MNINHLTLTVMIKRINMSTNFGVDTSRMTHRVVRQQGGTATVLTTNAVSMTEIFSGVPKQEFDMGYEMRYEDNMWNSNLGLNQKNSVKEG